MSVDTATCDDCLAEVDDPADRRFRYPFTNCTNCGPRYTIVLRVPYDRPATTMRAFPMCAACRAEYDDPSDRRFHAQPNACPQCGPRLTWRSPSRRRRWPNGDDALARGGRRAPRRRGRRGEGHRRLPPRRRRHQSRRGRELRRRKARDDKPFAVMVPDLDAARAVCVLDDDAVAALESPRRPIVLAPRRTDSPAATTIAPRVAPGLPDLGVFLPYSPLHHLLLAGVGRPLVMTSGNSSDEPIAHDDDDATPRLGPMVDGLLTHDREIHIRCDDSGRSAPTGSRLQLLRRSRGYAPEPHAAAVRRATRGARGRRRAEVDRRGHARRRRRREPSHRRPRAPRDLPVVPPGRRPPARALRRRARRRRPRPPSGVPVDEVRARPRPPRRRGAAPPRARRRVHGRARPHRSRCSGSRSTVSATAPTARSGAASSCVADFDGFERVGHLRPVPMPGGGAAIREPWRMAAVWASARRRRPAERVRRRRPRDRRRGHRPRVARHRAGRPRAWAGCSTRWPRCSAVARA